ncbi:MAG: UDP-N-acetylmuramoyl-tripeptide--D-alanyl-D-alanine ligase, partial [Lachnospiraceae bacterium]|nr:UDP-N-acetylmuramoyl-tripeptide--D-alanyl-D-alanine ligase [Lachnospiraceae bacterium]
DEIGVIELGMSEPGELTIIARLAAINTAVITNIGDAHIEQFGSREKILREKMTIQDGLKDGGLLLLNGDDALLRGVQAKDSVRVLYYGTGAGCDYRAENIVLHDGKPEFTAVHGSKRCQVRLDVLGRHNVLNALAGIAVCAEYGMTLEEAARGLLTFKGFAHRQQLVPARIAGKEILLLDDSYNASPASLRAALDVFCRIRPGARHIAVLADMKELGGRSPEFHREAGEYAAASGVSLILTLGEDCSYLAQGVRATSQIPVMEFTEPGELTAYLERELTDGDLLLLKGSNSMGLTRLADRFTGKNGGQGQYAGSETR